MFKAWLIFAVILVFGTYFAFEANMFSILWEGDITKLSFLILFLTVMRFCQLGLLTYEYKRYGLKEIDLEEAYSMAETMMALGMMGTLIGFIYMLSSFNGVDLSDTSNITQLFELATSGMSTALYTTLAGLVSSTFIKSSYYALELRAIRDNRLAKIK